jgi:Na+-transporting NADH:ubiquinone oxidoreductase subunit NqrF
MDVDTCIDIMGNESLSMLLSAEEYLLSASSKDNAEVNNALGSTAECGTNDDTLTKYGTDSDTVKDNVTGRSETGASAVPASSTV